MNLVQIAILILSLLRSIRSAKSQEEMAAVLPSASGEFLKWLWENKEQIIEFVKVIIGLFPQAPPASTLSADEQEAELAALVEDLKS